MTGTLNQIILVGKGVHHDSVVEIDDRTQRIVVAQAQLENADDVELAQLGIQSGA